MLEATFVLKMVMLLAFAILVLLVVFFWSFCCRADFSLNYEIRLQSLDDGLPLLACSCQNNNPYVSNRTLIALNKIMNRITLRSIYNVVSFINVQTLKPKAQEVREERLTGRYFL